MNNSQINQYDYKIQLVDSKQENVSTLMINNLYMHSRYNPLEEARKIADSSYKKNHLHILFGLGIGYIADAIVKKLSDTDQLLIIEPNMEIFNIALKKKRNLKLFNNTKVQVSAGLDIANIKNKLHSYFQEYLGRFTIITSPNYSKLYPEFYKEILEKIKETLMMEVINNNTHHMFSNQWQENFISNLYTAFMAHNIKDFRNKLSCPIVIVSGGPSLTKQLPLLKNIKNHALIMCVGSTINSLLNENIAPDIVVTVDGGEPNYNHFKNINIDHIPMIYPLIVHKNIPLEHKGKQIIFNINDHTIMNKWTNQLLEMDLGIVQTGHSVANFCMDIAYQLSYGPICLIGQDLAYTNNQSHASGNKGFALIDETKIKARKMFYTEGYYNDKVLTDYVFHGMKKGFENHLENIRENGYSQEIYNCTEGGVKLVGFTQIPFQQFITKFCQFDHSEEIKNLFPDRKTPSINDWEKFRFKVIQLLDHYNEVLVIATQSLNSLEEVKNNQYLFNKNLSKKMDEYDEKLKKLLENEFIFYILKPTIFKVQHSYLEVENESDEETSKRIYNKSLLLYEGIKNASEIGILWLTDLISKIEKHL